ncbi:hypothetical protein ABCW43_02555 [Neorhizobium sp. IRAMC:178]|uniref:hypothetical protein n=1 Tax=Neorhizobium tunisiense TaxID=3144793 RepID=UPI0031F6C1C2
MLRSESDGCRDAAALTNPFVAAYSKVLIAARPSLDFNLNASILCIAEIAEKLT